MYQMHVNILISSKSHPVYAYLKGWALREARQSVQFSFFNTTDELVGADILFLVSCSEIVNKNVIDLYKHVLVIHASDLPTGKGFSPHVWEISQGAEFITLSLLEAADSFDSGRILKKIEIDIPKHYLYNEINEKLFDGTVSLIDFYLSNQYSIVPKDQHDGLESYYRKRTPKDSEIDPNISLASQFDLLRICDPNRYPAFFYLHGNKYIIKIEKTDGHDD
jgi:methionyl-tRNA formyltransferase